jgi:ribonuclease HI
MERGVSAANEPGDARTGIPLILRTDGASRGNPGPAAAGVAIERDDGTLLARGKKYLGVMTNNQAEYRALILGLQAAARYNPTALRVFMDSELIVRQMTGQYKVRDETLRPLYEEAQKLAKALPNVTFTHVLRGKNALADALANEALDEQARREREQAGEHSNRGKEKE